MTDSTVVNVAVALLLSLAGFVCLGRAMWLDREKRRKIEARLRNSHPIPWRHKKTI